MADDTTTTVPDDTPDTAGSDEPAANGGSRRQPRWSVLPWLVAAVALLVAAATTSAWLSLRSEAQAREQVQRAAEEFVLALTTWDATDGLEDTREELREAGTGDFLAEIDDLFGGTLGEELEEVGAVSTGEIEDVFVQRIQDDRAIALGVVVQQVETELAETPEVTVRSARLTLVREDGRWLVSDVQLLAHDAGAAVPDDAVPTEEATP
jgi:Mce-associated membrane protein